MKYILYNISVSGFGEFSGCNNEVIVLRHSIVRSPLYPLPRPPCCATAVFEEDELFNYHRLCILAMVLRNAFRVFSVAGTWKVTERSPHIQNISRLPRWGKK